MSANRVFTVLYLVVLMAALFATGERLFAGATRPALLSAAIAIFAIVRLTMIYRDERGREGAARKRNKR